MTFRIDYNVPTINREFGSVFVGDKNVAMLVVGGGWAKVDNIMSFRPGFPCLNDSSVSLLNSLYLVDVGERGGAAKSRSESLPSRVIAT